MRKKTGLKKNLVIIVLIILMAAGILSVFFVSGSRVLKVEYPYYPEVKDLTVEADVILVGKVIDAQEVRKINVDNLSANVDVTFDYDSRWELTGDSYINILQITKTDYLRKNVRKYIRSNGYNVYYNSANNEWLEGRTYNLQGGGKLIPLES